MSKRRIIFIIGNRAHYARVRSVITHMPKENYRLILFEAAMLSEFGGIKEQIIEEIGEKNVDLMLTNISGGNLVAMTKSTGIAISEFASQFMRLQPHIVVVVADRYESLAGAIAARYMNIPVAHIQGGEKTGSIDDSIRHAITKLANVHFVTNSECAQRIIRMGEAGEAVYVTGCPTIDICKNLPEKYPGVLFEHFAGVYEPKFTLGKDYLIVAFHPVTTEYLENKKNFDTLIETINELNMQTIWLYPNIDAGNDIMRKEMMKFKTEDTKGNIRFFRHFPIEYYLTLLRGARCIIGNSSVGIRESSFFGTPSVTVGTRQQGRARSKNVVYSKIENKELKRKIKKQIEHGPYESSNLYGDGEAGKRIAAVLMNRTLSIEKDMSY